jgi:hypothetical protein
MATFCIVVDHRPSTSKSWIFPTFPSELLFELHIRVFMFTNSFASRLQFTVLRLIRWSIQWPTIILLLILRASILLRWRRLLVKGDFILNDLAAFDFEHSLAIMVVGASRGCCWVGGLSLLAVGKTHNLELLDLTQGVAGARYGSPIASLSMVADVKYLWHDLSSDLVLLLLLQNDIKWAHLLILLIL